MEDIKDSKSWLVVDQAGLAKKLAGRGKEFVVAELIQNAWDAPGVTEVLFDCRYRNGKIRVSAQDNSPGGFADLRHSFTMFAPSIKEADFEARGRFNIGEKFVFAISESARVQTTTGTVVFSAHGRKVMKERLPLGSIITCVIPATVQEYEQLLDLAGLLLEPPGIKTIVNGAPLPRREPETTFGARLRTEAANEAGILRPVERQATVGLFRPLDGQKGRLYEMGIPIMETGDKWDYNIAQKVPLTLDRKAVAPSFLAALRIATFNETYQLLSEEDCSTTWVQQAIESGKCLKPAVMSYMEKRFTQKRVAYDPSDPEANKLAVSRGFTVVYGNTLSSNAWKTVKEADAILPAGKVTPSPKPFAPGAPPYKVLEQETEGMARVKKYSQALAKQVMGVDISVIFADDAGWFPAAVYGPSLDLIFNVPRLGRDWFNLTGDLAENRCRINQLLIHEFGHQYSSDHLSAAYHEAICRIGAKIAEIAAAGQLPPL